MKPAIIHAEARAELDGNQRRTARNHEPRTTNAERDLWSVILIRFTDREGKRRALEALAGEFSFKSWSSGEMLLPEDALAVLARQDIPFAFEGSAAYEKVAPLRDPAASAA